EPVVVRVRSFKPGSSALWARAVGKSASDLTSDSFCIGFARAHFKSAFETIHGFVPARAGSLEKHITFCFVGARSFARFSPLPKFASHSRNILSIAHPARFAKSMLRGSCGLPAGGANVLGPETVSAEAHLGRSRRFFHLVLYKISRDLG